MVGIHSIQTQNRHVGLQPPTFFKVAHFRATEQALIFSPTPLLLFTSHLNPRHPIIPSPSLLESKDVMDLPRVSLRERQLVKYQRRPELLQRATFVSFDEDEAEYKVFRVPAFITADQERIFYVVHADEGPKAVACTSVDLFDLLRTSEQVLN